MRKPDAVFEKITDIPMDFFKDKISEWHFVDYFEDFSIQLVDSFSDIRIKYVDSFPGIL